MEKAQNNTARLRPLSRSRSRRLSRFGVPAMVALVLGAGVALDGCAARRSAPADAAMTTVPGTVSGTNVARTNVPRLTGGAQTGYATFLGASFHGNESASGEIFDSRELVAAHRTLPFGSIVRVTNLENGRSVTVRIIDRGPYGKNFREGTIIDLSRAAAKRVRMIREGQVPVRLLVLRLGDQR